MAESLISNTSVRERAHAPGWRVVVPWVATTGALILFLAQNGGYFPTTWNWAALAVAWVTALAFILRQSITVSRLQMITVGALFALFAWVSFSVIWTNSIPSTVFEMQRDVLYVVSALAVLALYQGRSARTLLGSIYVAIALVAWYALATRIFPNSVDSANPVSEYRLSRPVGYWNALGVLAGMGILLGVGFAARGRRGLTRLFAAASLVVLAPTLYFTYSRGAAIAAVIGLVAAFVLDTRRLQLITTILVLTPAPAIAVLIASRLDGLTRKGSTLAQARHDGHRLALILLLLALGAGLLRWGQDRLGQSLVISTNARRAYVGALIAAGAALLAVVVVQFGSPQAVANRAWTSFTAAPPVVSKNLNTRLFSLSSNGRTAMWHQAWRDYREHPVLGSGAGTFEIWYLQHRTGDLKVRDAHSLYLEMLAEVGPIGLALLLIALATPLVAAARRRRHPLVPIACGAYIVFIVHAGVDWDWEMSAVTAVGLLCGLALLIADRADSRLSPLIRARYAFAGAAVAVALFSSVGLLGNIPASHAARAIEAGDWSRAGAEARKEIRWAPWAADGWRRLGQAELGSNKRAAAVRHLHKAIRLDPQNWDRWFDLALATTGAAQRRALERALELNPRSPEIAEFVAGLGLRGIAAPAKGSG